MSNAHEVPLHTGDILAPNAVVEVSPTVVVQGPTPCTCPASDRVPLAQLNPKDPVLRSYLAPPTEPTTSTVSPARTMARREAAGIGFATGTLLLILFLIFLGLTPWSLLLALGGAIAARALVWTSRVPAVRRDEQSLADQAKAQIDVYRARRAAWDRLSYCARCRYVVDELTGDSRPLHAAHELLVLSPIASNATNAPA